MIAAETIDKVKDACRIEDVVAEVVTLKKEGANLKGCCPFHNEKTPSFVVNPVKGFYKCFGCGEGGDAITFVMNNQGKTYPDAIEYLARKYNIAIAYEKQTEEQIQQKTGQEKLHNVITTASAYYKKSLADNQQVIQYIKDKRQITDDTIALFQLGYAPVQWQFITDKVKGTEYEETALRLSLIKKGQSGRLYDVFRNRVTIPITDRNGRIIAFGGEALNFVPLTEERGEHSEPEGVTGGQGADSTSLSPLVKGDEGAIATGGGLSPEELERITGKEKYRNSTEAEGFFNKGSQLFGLSLAIKEMRKQGQVIIVEGYYDCINFHDKGVTNTVATMGTAFTDEQAKLIKRYCNRVFIARDPDNAGHQSAIKAVDTCLANGLSPYYIPMPAGMDPDKLAQAIAAGLPISLSPLFKGDEGELASPGGGNNTPTLGGKGANAGGADGAPEGITYKSLSDYIFKNVQDGITWKISCIWQQRHPVTGHADAVKQIIDLIALEPDELQRQEYITTVEKAYKVKLDKHLKAAIKKREEEKQIQLDLEEQMPAWIDVNQLYEDGFVMRLHESEDGRYKVGIYFKGTDKPVQRLTNYAVKPLYFIVDANNSRRLVEVYNGRKTAVVELENKAFTSMDNFETSLISRGNYYSEVGFNRLHYKRLANWLTEKMPGVHELKTLGWQPEGFFAFANKIAIPVNEEIKEHIRKEGVTISATGEVPATALYSSGKITDGLFLLDYNEYGIVRVHGQNYLSAGVSKLNVDLRAEDNIYENDLYLSFKQSPVSFAKWMQIFTDVYEEHAPYGIAFIYIAAFKDLVTRVTKCPVNYFQGPKGSGKSAMAESIMRFFFSGLNAEGKLIQGYNLNPGQGTPFSFFSRLQRFRNVFMLFNEYDANTIEFWKKGAIKSSYDGEGREVGSGETGKKRKTEIQKVQCVLGIAGQYLDTSDEGSVMSRSVLNKFSLERNKNRTDEQKANWQQLDELEHKGISSLAAALFGHRHHIQKHLKDTFWNVQSELNTRLRQRGVIVESRILYNYSLCLALTKIMMEKAGIAHPYTYDEFYNSVNARITEHARLLRDNNILNTLFSTMEILIEDNHLRQRYHYKIITENTITVKEHGETRTKQLPKENTEVLYLRMNAIHDKFAKRYKEVHGKTAPDVDSLINYLKDQPYYLGMVPSTGFKETRTNAYACNYEVLKQMGYTFEKIKEPPAGDEPPEDFGAYKEEEVQQKIPFKKKP